MRNSNTIILQAIVAALSEKILPELKTGSSVQAGQTALALLGLLLSRENSAVVPEAQQKYQALHDKMRTLIQRHGAEIPSAVAEYPLGFLEEDIYGDAHASLLHTQERLRRAAARMIEIRDASQDKVVCAEIEGLLEEMAREELAITQKFLASLAIAPVAAKADVPVEVTQQTLETYLRARFPERRNLTVSNVGGAGFSIGKQIHFFDLHDGSGRHDKLVMRQEKPVRVYEGLDCSLIKNEYQLIKCAYGLGLPVPQPLWLESGGALGPDFMVMRKVGGNQIGEPFKAYRPMSEGLIMEIAEILAKLHGVGLGPFESFLEQTGQKAILGMDGREATIYRISNWEKFCESGNEFPNPGKTWLFDWLKKNAPENRQPPVMAHGDFGIHNLLEENGSISACLDWEWAHPGSPIEDLAYIRPHVDQYSNWDRFLNHYMAHGGPKVDFDKKVTDYYGCLSNALFSIISGRLAFHVANGDRSDIMSVFGANCYAFHFHQTAMAGSLKNTGGPRMSA